MVLSPDPSPKISLVGVDIGDLNAMTREDTLKELDHLYSLVKRQLLRFQSPTTGLFPAMSKERSIGSVRDSIYCSTAVWALHQAYRRIDDDRGKSYELGQSAVFCMRGILACWMRQAQKLEQYKSKQCPQLALHSVFRLDTGGEILTSEEHNHLQLDVVCLYLIYLVQMISSGLEIIYSHEEVSFIQNLVFYVERAYRTPSFGTWGRGTKYNDGTPEVSASTVGMAKAALETVNGFNLFGGKAADFSIIYADIDAHNRNRSIFETLLPRESNSKNTDVSLLSTISFPAFATHDPTLYERSKRRVVRELQGLYGFKRFIGDGYGSEIEDKDRRFYKRGETLDFHKIENEWPIFFIFMIIDGVFKENQDQVKEYRDKIDMVMSINSHGDPIIPQMYIVPASSLSHEKSKPSSQKRKASNVHNLGNSGDLFLMGQAMYIIAELLTNKLLNLWELDPIRRYLPASSRPRAKYRFQIAGLTSYRLVVQIVMIAESTRLQVMLANYGIQTQTPTEVEPVQIWPPGEMVKLLSSMGRSSVLKLNGRPSRPIGSLGTCKLYRVGGRTVLCYPIIFSASDFYLSRDMALLISDIRSELQFVARCWRLLGRPTFCILITEDNMRDPQFNEMLKLLSEIKNGECGGVKIRLGRLQNLLASSCIESLDFKHEDEAVIEVHPLKERMNTYAGYQTFTDIPKQEEINEDLGCDFISKCRTSPTSELIQVVNNLNHMYGQIQVYGIILEREGLNFEWNGMSLQQRLEMFSKEAGGLRYWAALRYCTSLLKKMVDSLLPFATQIICNGKALAVGVIGETKEEFLTPMSIHDMHAALFDKVQKFDVIGAVLQQEIILYCGKLIATDPELFEGILVLRMGWIIRAMELYRKMTEPEQVQLCPLENMEPFLVRSLLKKVLSVTSKGQECDGLNNHQIKQLNGCLLRVPENFYPNVWHILKKCPGGLKFRDQFLPQEPTIRIYDPTELSFFHLVEKMFGLYHLPVYRNLIIRVITILAAVLKRNPEIHYSHTISMEEILANAQEIFFNSVPESSDKKVDQFLSLDTAVSDCYLGRAVVNKLLDGELDHESTQCTLQ